MAQKLKSVTTNLIHRGDREVTAQWDNGDTMKVRFLDDGTVQVYVAGETSARDAIDIRPVAGNVIRISVGTVRS